MMSVQLLHCLWTRSYFHAMLRAQTHWLPLTMSAFVAMTQWTSRTCGLARWEVCLQVLLLRFGSAESDACVVWPLVCLFNFGPKLRLILLSWSCVTVVMTCLPQGRVGARTLLASNGILLLQPSSPSDRRLQHSHREFDASSCR